MQQSRGEVIKADALQDGRAIIRGTARVRGHAVDICRWNILYIECGHKKRVRVESSSASHACSSHAFNSLYLYACMLLLSFSSCV